MVTGITISPEMSDYDIAMAIYDSFGWKRYVKILDAMQHAWNDDLAGRV